MSHNHKWVNSGMTDPQWGGWALKCKLCGRMEYDGNGQFIGSVGPETYETGPGCLEVTGYICFLALLAAVAVYFYRKYMELVHGAYL